MSKKFMQSRNHVHIFHVDLVLKLQFSLSKILMVVEIPCFHVNDSLVYSLHRCWDITFKSMIWCKKWDCVNYGFRLVDVKILDVGFDLLGYYFHLTSACAYFLFRLSLLWGFYYLFWTLTFGLYLGLFCMGVVDWLRSLLEGVVMYSTWKAKFLGRMECWSCI